MSKKALYLGQLILGAVLLAVGFFVFKGETAKAVSGISLGLGCGLLGMGGANVWMLRFRQTHPDETKQAEIERTDERNIMILNKAKAKSADIIQWFIVGVVYLLILIDAPLWLILTTVGVFVLKYALEFYLMYKYQKEL